MAATGQDPLADMQNLIGYQGLGRDQNLCIVQPEVSYFSRSARPPAWGWASARWRRVSRPTRTAIRSEALLRRAYRRPQQSAPGTTLNSMPAGGPSGTFNYAAMGSAGAPLQELMNNYQAAQAKLSPQQLYNQQQTRQMDFSNAQNIANLNMNRTAGGGFGAGNNVINTGPSYAAPMQMGAAQPAAAQPAAAASAPAGALSRTQYLSLLANPGKPTAYGAAPPGPGQTPTGAMGPNVTNAFLAANAGKSTPYLSTLRNLQGGTA